MTKGPGKSTLKKKKITYGDHIFTKAEQPKFVPLSKSLRKTLLV